MRIANKGRAFGLAMHYQSSQSPRLSFLSERELVGRRDLKEQPGDDSPNTRAVISCFGGIERA